jgi:hypothetical protein
MPFSRRTGAISHTTRMSQAGRRSSSSLAVASAGFRSQMKVGAFPCWSPDGRELYWKPGDTFMTADVVTQPTLRVSKPRSAAFRVASLADSGAYRPSADGRRFLVIDPDPRCTAGAPEHRPRLARGGETACSFRNSRRDGDGPHRAGPPPHRLLIKRSPPATIVPPTPPAHRNLRVLVIASSR